MNNFRCERSSPFRNDFDLLELHVTCGAGEGEDAGATPASASFLFDDISTIDVENGTFCYAENSLLQTSPGGGLYQVKLFSMLLLLLLLLLLMLFNVVEIITFIF